jgi:diguanylate cyclase (GGDEF)-like protein
VILPETGLESAAESAERIRRQIEAQELGARGAEPGITVSIGVASFPENGHDPEDIIGQADSAMYGGKRGGRNRVEIASGTRERRKTATSDSN